MLALKRFFFSTLLRLARSRVGGTLFRWSFVHMNRLLPVNRIYESEQVMAFVHPQPAYRFHFLILPKRDIPSLMALSGQEADLLSDVIRAAQEIVRKNHLQEIGYRLVVNGGPNQQVPILHFHLIAD